MKLNELTINKAKEGLLKKEFSSTELTVACLEQIKTHDEKLNSFITLCEEKAIEDAKKADAILNSETTCLAARRAEQLNNRPLLGIPIALKDLYLTKGIKTTAGSKVLGDYIPEYDATVVEKLKNAGAIIIGKTNCDAWAHGSSGENSDFGPTKNPWDLNFVPGGSSSGSAVSVSTDMCLAASGTDTGGSVRQPASFCNVVGLKPTYGRVSRYGIVAMASSLDSIGHFTKTVEDCAIYLNVTAGKDKHDATTPEIEVPDYTKNLNKGVKGIKIGIPKEYFSDGVDPKIIGIIKEALKKLEMLGAEIVDISLPSTKYTISTYYIIQPAEVSSNLARYDGIRYGSERQNFGDEAKRRIILGTFVLSVGYYDSYYKKAMQVRTLIKKDFERAFNPSANGVDAIITPVSPTLPWKIGEKVNDPLKMYLSDIFTVTANLAGIPGLSIPVGFSEGLPVGMQILGPQFSEDLLFQIGNAYEKETEWHKQKPIL